MCRGFRGPPDSHLFHSELLHADELNCHVIESIKGFEFVFDDVIERKLIQSLELASFCVPSALGIANEVVKAPPIDGARHSQTHLWLFCKASAQVFYMGWATSLDTRSVVPMSYPR